MSIEIGSKWVKDGEVVEVTSLPYCMSINMVIFQDKTTLEHVLSVRDFFEQYKPYEVVYEYFYAYKDCNGNTKFSEYTYTDEKWARGNSKVKEFQRLDFTKRERK